MMYDPNDSATVLKISHNRDLFRFLQNLAQSTGHTHIRRVLADPNLTTLSGEIPGITELLQAYADLRAHLLTNGDDAYRYGAGRTLSPKGREYLKALGAAYKPLNAWGKAFVGTAARLRAEGLIPRDPLNPNREGPRFKLAESCADHLASMWFVKRVVLFGSVAKGTDTDHSDIDLAIDVHTSSIRVLDAMEYYLKNAAEETGIRISSVLIGSQAGKTRLAYFDQAAFFDSSLVLYEAKALTLTCGGKTMEYPVESLVDLSVSDRYTFVLLNAGNGTAHCVLADTVEGKILGIFSGVRDCRPTSRRPVIPRWIVTETEVTDLLSYETLTALCDFSMRHGSLLAIDPVLVLNPTWKKSKSRQRRRPPA